MVTATALAVTVALAWVYLVWFATTMSMPVQQETGMPMDMGVDTGMAPMDEPPSMGTAMQRALTPWSVSDLMFTASMWVTMMIGMMTPSAAPMILLYARVGQSAAAQGKPFAPTAWFFGGYLLAWSTFAIAATSAQWLLEHLALLGPMMSATSHVLGGGILILAGLYQWTPLKHACLGQCRAPLTFIQQHGGFKRDAFGSLRLGLLHGLYCIGCCWALMALLFVGGVMSPLWIAGITLLVLLEKLLPTTLWLSRSVGIAMIVGGVWLLVS